MKYFRNFAELIVSNKILILIFFAITVFMNYIYIYYEKKYIFDQRIVCKADVFLLSSNGYFCMLFCIYIMLFWLGLCLKEYTINMYIKHGNFAKVWMNHIGITIKIAFLYTIILTSACATVSIVLGQENINFDQKNSIFALLTNGATEKDIILKNVIFIFIIYIFILFLNVGMLFNLINWIGNNYTISLILSICVIILLQYSGVTAFFDISYVKFANSSEWEFLQGIFIFILLSLIGFVYSKKKEIY